MEIKDSIFWNLVRIVWQKKKIFIISFVASMLITFIVTTLMPKTYKASLTFIVNEESSGFNITSLLSDLPFDIGGMGTSKADKYIALLGSRAIRDSLINEFDLWDEYGEEYIEFIYEELSKNIEVIDNLDNTVTINSFFENSPQKAFDMVNRTYELLYNYSLKLNKEKSKDYREFLEKSLDETYATLAQLEDSMKTFQIKNKVLKFEEQTEFSFQALAEIEAQNLLYQVQYDYLKKAASKNNPELIEVTKRLEAIEKTKQDLYQNGEDYVMAFNKMPELGLTYFRLFREITIQQEVLKILLPIVQNARIEEKKETVNIQVINKPFVPQYKVKPKRLLYMIVVTFLVIFLELLYFSFMDAYKKNKEQIDTWVTKG